MTKLTPSHQRLVRELGLTSTSPRKEPGIAAVLSFVWTGAGHIYNGHVGRGIALVVIYFLSIVFWFLILPIFLTFGLWIWGMIASARESRQINEAIDALVASEKANEEETRARAARAASEAFTSMQFRESLKKLIILREQGVYSMEETEEEVNKCIIALQSKQLETDKANYLVVAAEMRKAGLVSEAQLHSLKALLL